METVRTWKQDRVNRTFSDGYSLDPLNGYSLNAQLGAVERTNEMLLPLNLIHSFYCGKCYICFNQKLHSIVMDLIWEPK